MAEIVVNLVLGKLAEPPFVRGLADVVEPPRQWFTWVQTLLKDADSKCNKDERVKRWVKDVKEVAYMMEDALDMYLVTRNERDIVDTLEETPEKPTARQKLTAEIDKVLARISEISDFKTKYGILELKTSTDSAVSTQQQPVGRLVNPEVDDDVVGLEDAMKTIIGKLTDSSIPTRSVLSIVGQPGQGKTTLARKVYKSGNVRSHFDSRIWLSIFEEFDLIKILSIIIGKIKNRYPDSLDVKERDDLIVWLHELLKEKKYLIVLEDIRENQSDFMSDAIQNALPDSINGSRVLITTRFIEVAKKLDSSNDPYKLALLNGQESQKLLLKKACRNCNCPDELLPLAQQLSEKCAGFPLALVLLGGQLSMTNLDYRSWNNVMKTLDWNDHKDTICMDAISTSYQALPLHLKQCFIYLALFPKDEAFEAKYITRLWIAEGFIKQNQNSSITMEDTADECLKELAQRCMVQVSKKCHFGKINNYWKLHDLICEFAIKKAEEIDTFTVLSETKNPYISNNLERRVALQCCEVEQIEKISSNLHSLIAFDTMVPNVGRFRLLRVLHVEYGSEILDDDGYLSNLRYLYSHYPYPKNILPCFTLSKNLQTVSIEHVEQDFSLPPEFWDLKKLRHVILPFTGKHCGPPSSAELKNLLTLVNAKPLETWSSELPLFPRLRELGISLYEDFDWEPFTELLRYLEELESLEIKSKWGIVPIQVTPSFTNFKCMQSLRMVGKQAANDFTMLPPNLVELKMLIGAKLDEDPLPQLEKLPHLQFLQIIGDSYSGSRMACSKGGFPRLQKLEISGCLQLEEWNIEDGAMPIITKLQLSSCKMLQMVPNFQHLTSLRKLTMCNISPQFKMKLEGEDKYKVDHISSIIISCEQMLQGPVFKMLCKFCVVLSSNGSSTLVYDVLN